MCTHSLFAATWQAASGNWTSPADWGGSLPADSEQCYINNDGTCQIDSIILTNNNRIHLGNTAGSLNKLEILPGAVHTNDGIRLGATGTATGTVEQTGGWIWSTGWNFIQKGCTWTTSDGYYRNPGNNQFIINGGGTLTQTGGTNYFHTTSIGAGGGADGTALYEISGGKFEASWVVVLASDPTAHSVLHINGSQPELSFHANAWERLTLEGTNAELKVTLDEGGASTIEIGGAGRYANITNGVLTVNSALYSINTNVVTLIQAGEIRGTLSETNFIGTVESADVIVESGDLKITNIVFVPGASTFSFQ